MNLEAEAMFSADNMSSKCRENRRADTPNKSVVLAKPEKMDLETVNLSPSSFDNSTSPVDR
jgi:hypothetical protein